jgi:hypothetical protein
MRWSGTRSIPRESVEYDADTGLKMLVTATKTAGPGKRVVVLECYLSAGAYFYRAGLPLTGSLELEMLLLSARADLL